MPGLSGMEVCKRIRAAGMKTPLIVLSAIGDEMDKVLLLEIGADDYVVKPFGTRELLARIRALLRRSSPEETKVLAFGEVEVDLTRRIARHPQPHHVILLYTQNALVCRQCFLRNRQAERFLRRVCCECSRGCDCAEQQAVNR